MSKRTVTKWWVLGTVAIALAAILIIADAVALAAHLDAMAPGTRQGFMSDDVSRSMVILIAAGLIIAGIGLVAGFVAWIGALANTHSLADRRWFNALLLSWVVGIVTVPVFGLGAAVAGSAMLAYLVGGPDASSEGVAGPRPAIWAKPTILRWAMAGLVSTGAAAMIALLIADQTNRGGLLEGQTWMALTLLTTCASVMACGLIAASVSWWAAVFNTHELADKTWFQRVGWSGIAAALTMPFFGLGALVAVAAGVAYGIAAPDASVLQQPRTNVSTATG